ncbi:formyltransferase family protein, partial [Rubellimicrobium sp. CFH 75288]|uniref:formyltransferase family protein n=1 Tax=Rubellimicrobium sp. CFH 75288 TaxID=2697034 RepID=UPI00144DAD67
MTSAVLLGHDTLALETARAWTAAGHRLVAVATRHDALAEWAVGQGVPLVAPGPGLADRLSPLHFDWLLSVANLDLLPEAVLRLPARGAVNFHDAPLPERAGLNAPVWALLEGAAEHGITWHLIEAGVDTGPVLVRRRFAIAPDETALSLNTRCLEAALDSLPELFAQLAGTPRPVPQDPARRLRLHRAKDRPEGAAVLDPGLPAPDLAALVRALDHGPYPNPVAAPKIDLGDGLALVGRAETAPGGGEPGLVLGADARGFVMVCGTGALRLEGLVPLGPGAALPAPGTRLPRPDAATRAAREAALAATPPGEAHWRARLLDLRPAALPPLGGSRGAEPLRRPLGPGDAALALAALARALA